LFSKADVEGVDAVDAVIGKPALAAEDHDVDAQSSPSEIDTTGAARSPSSRS
jgi:hypothetical protein